MHIDSLLLPKSKTSNTYSPASPPDLLILTSHPPQNGWALCGLLMPKDKLPLTYFTTGKGNPVETEAGKYKTFFKMSIKKKKILWLHKNHLEKFGKSIDLFQVCPVCSANIEISSDSECLHCHCDLSSSSAPHLPHMKGTAEGVAEPHHQHHHCRKKSLSGKTKWCSGEDKGRRRGF